jgi:conjugative relaxase-like TrwC/TraI family protein
MTIHKVSAGDGYDYLTRQVAVADQDLAKGQDLAGYYTASGEPPGMWAGQGCRDLGVSGTVRDDQMQSLWGEGYHPDADILGPLPLGRAFPTFSKGATPYSKSYMAGLQLFREQNGRGATEPERRALRLTAARATLLDMGRPASARNPAAVAEFVASQRRMERQAVAGYDLTFSPAKSISTLWAVAGHDVRALIEEAHRQAWQESLAYIEQEAGFTRTGAGGVAQIETHGLVAAAFDHRTSRTGDPDLHTHVVLSSKVLGVDGKWRSLDGRPLYAIGVTASEMYNARLEDALVSRLGVAVHDVERTDPGKRPVREIAGVSPKLMKAFSRRREAIEQRYEELLRGYVAEHGKDPSRSVQARMSLYQQATLETREAKAPGIPLAQRVAEWQVTADRVLGETGRDRMLRTVFGSLHEWDTRSLPEIAERVLGLVSEERSTWKPMHVRAEAERQLRAHPLAVGERRDAVVDEVQRLVLGPGGMSVRLTMDALGPLPAELVRSNGESVFRVHGQVLYTSEAVLAAEARLVAAGRETTPYSAAVQADLLIGLTAGQADLVKHFAGVGTQLAVGVGAAGVGKSFAMARLVQAWQAGGRRVIGLAPSADAAIKLGEEIKAQAQTIDLLLTRHEHGLLTPADVRAGDMLLVDEAGKAGTRNLDRLLTLAAERGAVVRLVGDPHQLGSVSAGGAFRLLAHELGAAEMLDVLRFRDPEEAAASLQLRTGDQAAADYYLDRGRVHEGTTVDVADQVYRGWMTDRDNGRSTIMMAASNAAVAGLNQRAQAELRTAGVITGEPSPLRDDQTAGVGDVVLTRRNDRRITVGHRGDWVRNGSLFTVKAIGADGSLTVQRLDGDAVTTLPADYVRTHVDLGYASTIDRAQGITVDTARVIAHIGMTRQQLYAALTRGRAENHAHVEVEQQLDVDVERAPDARADSDVVLRQIIARDGAERSATETLREEMDAPHRLDSLIPQYTHAIETLGTERQHAKQGALAAVFGQQQAAVMLADPAGDALLAELNHHPDMAAAVATAAAERDLSSAESVAQVMQWRLEKLRKPGVIANPDDGLAGPLPWLPTVPDAPAGELHDWTVRRAQAIADRAHELAELVDADRPAWASALGDRPGEPAAARDWDRAAALAAAYREQFAVTDESSILGPDQPAKGTQGRAREAAAEAVQVVEQWNRPRPADRPTPPSRRPEHRDGPPAPRPYEGVGDQDLAQRLAAAEHAVSLTGGQLAAILRRDPDRSAPLLTGSAMLVHERSRRALEQQLAQAQVSLQELTEERQHRVNHPEALVPDDLVQAGSPRPAVSDATRTGNGHQGRVRAATDEPTRVASPDMAAEDTTQTPELPPETRPYAAVGDRALTARIKATHATVTVTAGQLDAMAQIDQEREIPLPAPAAKMRARARWALQRQLDGARTELREMTEEELRRTEHPELSVPDTAAELRATTDHRRAQEPMDIAVDHRGPVM